MPPCRFGPREAADELRAKSRLEPTWWTSAHSPPGPARTRSQLKRNPAGPSRSSKRSAASESSRFPSTRQQVLVARERLVGGAAILNDVSALRDDSEMAAVALRAQAVILMHRGGRSPKTMQDAPQYADVVAEVNAFLAERREAFRLAGGDPSRILLDPGIGFGKSPGHNLSLLKHLQSLAGLGPLVLGVSRKSFLASVTPDSGPAERLEGSRRPWRAGGPGGQDPRACTTCARPNELSLRSIPSCQLNMPHLF